jgi:lipopolysaccharide/colanic/teichoic acid biosynthesis glycosyltransferase
MVSTLREHTDAFRCRALIGHDAAVTLCGFYGAVLLAGTGRPAATARELALAAGLLVAMRIASVMTTQVHLWNFRGAGVGDLFPLVSATMGSSLMFGSVSRSLPASVYVTEFLLTTGLMAVPRYRHLLAGERAGVQRALAAVRVARQRRVLNVAVAAVAIALTLPVWILIAVAVKLTSRGPVFYTQERVGLDRRATSPLSHDPRRKRDLGGRPFVMYKFRTMRLDAEARTGAVWSGKNDPRVTPIGKFLRHSRLDELPQLINVLKGDMNIVGPRPERPTIFAELREKIPNYQHRQRVPPGITGFAQVNLEYDATLDDVANKVRYDLDYVSNESVTADVYIMARTVPVMLFRDRMLKSGASHAQGSMQKASGVAAGLQTAGASAPAMRTEEAL